MATLQTLLEQVPDHRKAQGKEYRLSAVLLLVLSGFLCGCDTLMAVWRFAGRLSREQREALGFLWFKIPSHSTLCITLHGLDVEALESALSQAALESRKEGETLHLSIDGKRLRGSATEAMPKGAQMLACFSDQLKAVVKQRASKGGYDEVTAAIALLKELPLKDTVITGDALFADRHLCDTIVQGSGHYVLPVKDNQPALKAAILRAVGEKSRKDA